MHCFEGSPSMKNKKRMTSTITQTDYFPTGQMDPTLLQNLLQLGDAMAGLFRL